MARRRELWGLALYAAWSISGAAASAQDASAEKTLTEKGLKKAAPSFYVVEGEAEFAKAMTALKPLQKALADAERELAAQKRTLEEQEELEVQATKQNVVLNAQLAGVKSVADNNRIVGMLNALNGQRELLAKSIKESMDRIEQLRAKAGNAREAYLQALLNARNLVGQIDGDYAKLAADESLATALAAVSQGDKKYTLGPSARHARSIKDLEKLEGSVISEKINLRPENGVFWVDTIINGKHTKSMVVDSGASIVTFPYELAVEVGVAPTSDDPTVRLKIATGQIVEGKLKTLASLKVGGFEVEDLDVVVLPDGLVEVDPLLGGSFLNNFTYRIDPDTKELRMTAVGGTTKAAPKGR